MFVFWIKTTFWFSSSLVLFSQARMFGCLTQGQYNFFGLTILVKEKPT